MLLGKDFLVNVLRQPVLARFLPKRHSTSCVSRQLDGSGASQLRSHLLEGIHPQTKMCRQANYRLRRRLGSSAMRSLGISRVGLALRIAAFHFPSYERIIKAVPE